MSVPDLVSPMMSGEFWKGQEDLELLLSFWLAVRPFENLVL